jgi:MIP family channel proteins
MMNKNLYKKSFAEFLGTFMIVFGGCGAVAISDITNAFGHLGIAIAFGLSVMTMIYALGHISGAHFNPAVTIAFAFTRHFPKKEIASYLVFQFLGALCAAAVLHLCLLDIKPELALGVTKPINGSFFTASILEAIASFFLMFVIMSVATDYRAVAANAGWAIGGMVWLLALVLGPIQGASMNPARSVGPAIIAGDYEFLLAYIIGPIIGALLGAFAYKSLRCNEGEDTQVKGCC